MRECIECGHPVASESSYVNDDRMIAIPYACSCGAFWEVTLPLITDLARRQEHQLATRARIAAATHERRLTKDPATMARQLEERRRRGK